MTKYFSILVLALIMFGCDIAKDMKEMGEKQAKVQKVIKDQYGWESQVGFNIHNGVLTQVTVVFNADEVREEKVATLEVATKEAVSKSFSAQPEAIFIQIASTVEQ